MRLKGRHWAAFWLVAFLAVAWVVIARQTSAIRAARELSTLHEERAALSGKSADLERRIRTAESRTVLLPLARRHLGLRVPTDTEIVLLPAPGGAPR